MENDIPGSEDRIEEFLEKNGFKFRSHDYYKEEFDCAIEIRRTHFRIRCNLNNKYPNYYYSKSKTIYELAGFLIYYGIIDNIIHL